jgi:hypothetical protein
LAVIALILSRNIGEHRDSHGSQRSITLKNPIWGFLKILFLRKPWIFREKPRLFAENHSENPQLFGFCGCQLVKSLSIGFRDVHVQIVV